MHYATYRPDKIQGTKVDANVHFPVCVKQSQVPRQLIYSEVLPQKNKTFCYSLHSACQSHKETYAYASSRTCICVCECRRGVRVQVRVTKGQLFSPSHSHFLCPKLQNHTVTLTIIQAHIKLTKADKDLYSPQLKKTSLGKRRKFSQRIGTPHCSERYKYTHIHTHNCTHILTRTHSGY